jgi:hypothetical protein
VTLTNRHVTLRLNLDRFNFNFCVWQFQQLCQPGGSALHHHQLNLRQRSSFASRPTIAKISSFDNECAPLKSFSFLSIATPLKGFSSLNPWVALLRFRPNNIYTSYFSIFQLESALQNIPVSRIAALTPAAWKLTRQSRRRPQPCSFQAGYQLRQDWYREYLRTGDNPRLARVLIQRSNKSLDDSLTFDRRFTVTNRNGNPISFSLAPLRCQHFSAFKRSLGQNPRFK